MSVLRGLLVKCKHGSEIRMRKRVADSRTDSGSQTASACGRGRGSVVRIRGLMRTQHFWIRTPLVQTSQNFPYMWTVAVAQTFSDSVHECNTLCTFSFVDDVMFGDNQLTGHVLKMTHQGQSLISLIDLLLLLLLLLLHCDSEPFRQCIVGRQVP